jgi:hypothetical protein
LIEEIGRVAEDGRRRIEARAELAGLLSLCEVGKKPGGLSAVRLAAPIKVVAGVGFEPTTFRL